MINIINFHPWYTHPFTILRGEMAGCMQHLAVPLNRHLSGKEALVSGLNWELN
jgi:hypothetical protein